MRSRTLLSSVLLVVFLSLNSLAQQSHQSPNQTGWLLEVTYLKGSPPAYERVRLPGTKMPGDWFARFGQVAGWQLPEGAQPIRAVRISNRLRKDETIRIRVSVLRGAKHLDAEETVATYDLRENEKVTVEPLQKFGIEPFELRAFKTEPLPANPPPVINKTTSVEVISVEPVASDMPEYKLTLRNLSTKTIEALRVELVDGEKRLSSGMPQGLEGRPLIPGGATAQVRIPMEVKAYRKEDAYSPVVALSQQVVIKSAVFADGTYEGLIEREIESGIGFQSVKFGRRVELRRALPLFAAALESMDAISTNGASRFLSQLEKLDMEISDAEFAELQQEFPTGDAKVLKSGVELGIHVMRKEILDQLAHFQTNAKGSEFRSWLMDNQQRYSQWLARLEAPEPSARP